MLSNASDWKIIVDLPGVNFVFPPEIFNTNERPDIVIWSAKLKKVLLIELTCPAEEGFTPHKFENRVDIHHFKMKFVGRLIGKQPF